MTTTVLFNQIPFSANDLLNPGRGLIQWHDRIDVNYPNPSVRTTPYDVYWRFVATRICKGARGVYDWSYFDNMVNTAVAKRQTIEFGIMQVYPEGTPNEGLIAWNGGYTSVPVWLMEAMNQSSQKPWKSGSCWLPNYNNPVYHDWLFEFHKAVYDRIVAKGWKKYFSNIDIRGYGSWGEWHSANTVELVSEYPAGSFPTVASFKKIVDSHSKTFVDIQLQAMISGFDAMWLNNTKNPNEIAEYLLTQGNQKGLFGWRRDNWGATDNYLKDYLENNHRGFGSIPAGSGPTQGFKVPIMNRWHVAPITGEPPAWIPGDYYDLERQVTLHHCTCFGNGNYGTNTPNSTIANRVREAAKRCGYRFVIAKAVLDYEGSKLKITSDWQNIGGGNLYRDYDVVFELVGTTWKGTSKLVLNKFQPASTVTTIVDDFTLTGVTTGTYQLKMSVVDRQGYQVNIALGVDGADSERKYSLGPINVGAVNPPVPNVGPKADAGSDQVITYPVNSVLLGGVGTDVDGRIVRHEWKILSGSGRLETPTQANTRLLELTPGATVVQYTVWDDDGASNSDLKTVTVLPGVTPEPEPEPLEIKSIQANIASYKVTYVNDSSEVIPA